MESTKQNLFLYEYVDMAKWRECCIAVDSELLYSIDAGNDGALPSASDANRRFSVIKLLDSTSNVLSVFIRRWEITKTYVTLLFRPV
jgi:hypothetical protein